MTTQTQPETSAAQAAGRQRPITANEFFARQAFLSDMAGVPGMQDRVNQILDSNEEARELFVAASMFFFQQGVNAATSHPVLSQPGSNGQHVPGTNGSRLTPGMFERAASPPVEEKKPAKKPAEKKPAAAKEQPPAPAPAAPAPVVAAAKKPADPAEGTNKRKVLDFVRSKNGRATAQEVGAYCEKVKPEPIGSHHTHLSQLVNDGLLLRPEAGVYVDPFHPSQQKPDAATAGK